jgi:chromosome segregation ATPase
MSAPITEAHLRLANQIVASPPSPLVMATLIADGEAVAVQTAMLREYGNLSATNESLAKERDQLRAEVATEKNLHAQTRTVVEELNTVCTDLKNAGGPPFIRSEAIRLLREDQATLRAEVERLKRDYEYDHKCLHEVRDRCELWKQRAERAETEIKDRAAMMRDIMRERDAAEAELAAERARRDDLVADINDACITLASAKDDCDDYAMQNTGFKLEAVRDVLIQYIPNAAMKEGK